MIGTIICALVEWHQISRSGISATGRRHRSENGAGLFWWRRLAPWRLPEDFPQPIPWCIGPAASITRWSCLVRSTWCLTTRLGAVEARRYRGATGDQSRLGQSRKGDLPDPFRADGFQATL